MMKGLPFCRAVAPRQLEERLLAPSWLSKLDSWFEGWRLELKSYIPRLLHIVHQSIVTWRRDRCRKMKAERESVGSRRVEGRGLFRKVVNRKA